MDRFIKNVNVGGCCLFADRLDVVPDDWFLSEDVTHRM